MILEAISMETTITRDMTPTTDAEYEAAIGQLLNEMERMIAPLAEKQQRSENLQRETRLMLSQLQETLSRLEAA